MPGQRSHCLAPPRRDTVERMARLSRVVVPFAPHHVTQRGNRRQPVFFGDDDYRDYRDLVAAFARKAGTEIWAYCLMPNHVHLIMTPRTPTGLHGVLAEAHRRYTRAVNARHGWTGFLWQGRFSFAPMDEAHLAAALRYVSLNPVRARLVARAQDWPWSSARAHLAGRDDELVRVAPLIERLGDMREVLALDASDEEARRLRRAETTGRPLGDAAFLAALEAALGRTLAKRKPGPRPGQDGA